MSASVQDKSTLTAWERWELASFNRTADLPAQPHVEVSDVAFGDADRDKIASEIRAEIRAEAEAEGRAAGYTAGEAEGRKNGQEAGHREGHASGYAEGLAQGRAEAAEIGKEEAVKLMQITEKLDQRIAELGPVVADNLLALAMEISRQVIRQTIAHHPEIILGVIREALSQLPLQQAAIHLHPEDAALVRRLAGEELSHASHRIREDPKLERGDVVIESGGSHLDASLTNRWSRAVASLGNGGEPWLRVTETPREK
jgi:flagellar assembly protein FliH